jgi:hypothetical protein
MGQKRCQKNMQSNDQIIESSFEFCIISIHRIERNAVGYTRILTTPCFEAREPLNLLVLPLF